MELMDEQKHRAALAAIMELQNQREGVLGPTLYVEVENVETVILDGLIDMTAVVEAIAVVL